MSKKWKKNKKSKKSDKINNKTPKEIYATLVSKHTKPGLIKS